MRSYRKHVPYCLSSNSQQEESVVSTQWGGHCLLAVKGLETQVCPEEWRVALCSRRKAAVKQSIEYGWGLKKWRAGSLDCVCIGKKWKHWWDSFLPKEKVKDLFLLLCFRQVCYQSIMQFCISAKSNVLQPSLGVCKGKVKNSCSIDIL